MNESLQVSREGRLLRVTLNRPEKRNALDIGLCRELVSELDRADADTRTGAVLLAGNGPSFCAGMDLDEVLGAPAPDLNRAHEQLFTVGARLTKPLVAAVHGAALGGGTGLAANCHVVVAADDAKFGLTEIRLGIWPFLIFRAVTSALGERRTVELSLTGRSFSAAEAREFGLVHHVVPAVETAARAAEIATALAEASPTAIRSGLTFVRETRERTWEQAGQIAREVRDQVIRSADFREGVLAFREKRAPRWPSAAGV